MQTLIDSFTFFNLHPSLMWSKTLAHLAISFASLGVALAIAIPLGVWLGHLHRASFLAINVSNVGRALPSLAVISIGIAYLGIGFWNVLVALVVLAAPVILTNAYVAVDQVDRNVVEAARAAGMTAPHRGAGGGSTASSASNVGNGRSVTLGTKNFTEEFIVGALYQQALQAKGYKVAYKPNIGATEVVDKALTSGQIDAYPEYTGESAVTVGGVNTTVTSAQQEYDLAKAFYAKRGQSMSQMTPFFDTDAIAVTKAYAAKYGLKTTADLKKVPHFTLGARPEFQGREQGALGIQKDYGVKNFTFKSLALGLQYQALDAGAVNAADVFTTDPQLAGGKYVVLTDPKHIFGFQNIALVINTKKLNELGGQQFMNIINQVNALLTTPAIIAMNKAVAIDKQQPGDVAKAFLSANHITS